MSFRQGKSNRHTQDMHQIIVMTAKELFMTYGFRSVTTRRIAKECGITQPALYHHFQNKEEIYIEVVRSIMDRTKADLNELIRVHTNLKKRLYHVSSYMIMNHKEDLSQMFHDLQHEMSKSTQDLIRGWWIDSYLNPVLHIINEAIDNGQIRDLSHINSSSTDVAFFFLDILKSVLQSANLTNAEGTVRQEVATKKSSLLVNIFLEGITE